jgi:hypothetical protein
MFEWAAMLNQRYSQSFSNARNFFCGNELANNQVLIQKPVQEHE